MKRTVLLVTAALIAGLILSSCASRAGATKTVVLELGNHRIIAELALTETERERGLMFRDSLADGAGMLFVFPADQRLTFWMKDTKIPLSIAYISHDGTIRDILDMKPFSLDSVGSSQSVRYALEVPQGYFGRIGAAVGDRVVIPESLR